MSFIQKRILNFETFKQIIEKYILLENQDYLEWFECYTKLFPNGKSQQDCILCQLPVYINEYGVHQYQNEILCGDCYAQFIDNNDKVKEFADFQNKVTISNAKIENLNANMQSNPSFLLNESMLTDIFKGFRLKEVEYALGNSIRYGDLDRGLASGYWNINDTKFEIWFQNEICTEVCFKNQINQSKRIFYQPNRAPKISVGAHILQRFGVFIFISFIFSFLFKKIYQPFDHTSIVGSDSDWLIIIFNFIFIVIFFFFLLIEAFRFNSDEKKYRYANLGMLLFLVLFVIVAFNS